LARTAKKETGGEKKELKSEKIEKRDEQLEINICIVCVVANISSQLEKYCFVIRLLTPAFISTK
jgi:hypothetical protein